MTATLIRPIPGFVTPSTALEPRTFIVSGTLVASTPAEPWKTQTVKLTVTTTHFVKAQEVAQDDARAAGFLLIDTSAVALPVPAAPTFDPTETQEQGEEVGR